MTRNYVGTLNRKNIIELLDGASIESFAPADGVIGNDVVNDTAAFDAADAWSAANNGRPVYIPPPVVRYRWDTAWASAGGSRLVGLGDVEIRAASTNNLLTVNGSDFHLENLAFLSDHANSNFLLKVAEGADRAVLRKLRPTMCPSFIRMYGNDCVIDDILAAQVRGTLVRIDGTSNGGNAYNVRGQNIQTVFNVDSDVTGGVASGPYNWKITRAAKWLVEDDLSAYQLTQTGSALFPTKYVYDEWGNVVETYGGDVVSMTFEAHHFIMEDLSTLNSRDGSGTINGNDCVIRGHRAKYGLGGGIGLFGSRCRVYDAEMSYMRRGIICSSAFGNFASYNQIFGGNIEYCRSWGIVPSQIGVRRWVSGGTYSSTARYCACWDETNQVWNFYRSSVGSDHFGDTPMTFTVDGDGVPLSGSDNGSGATWTWVSQGPDLAPTGNMFFGVRCLHNGRSDEAGIGSTYAGIANWNNRNNALNYRYGCHGTADGLISDYNEHQPNNLHGEKPVFRRITGGTVSGTTAVLTTDGLAPGADNQLVVSNITCGKIDGTLLIRDNDSQGFRAWAFTGTFRRTATAADPEWRGTPTFTMGEGTGLSWLDGITPAWSIDSTYKAIQISVTAPANASPLRGVSCRAEFTAITMLEIPEDNLGEAEEEVPPEEP